MNTSTREPEHGENLKARLWALISESPLWPHATKAVLDIKEQLMQLWVSQKEIENIETS